MHTKRAGGEPPALFLRFRRGQSSSDDEFDELLELEFDDELELELDEEFELEWLEELDELLELELLDEFDERLELELLDAFDELFDQLLPSDFLPPAMTVLKKRLMSSSACAGVCASGAAKIRAPRMARVFFICHLLFDNLADCRGGTGDIGDYSTAAGKFCR